MLSMLDEARAEGVTNIRGQHSGRPVGLLMGWQTSVHPFMGFPEYRPYAQMPFAERLEKLKDPEVRAKITEGRNVDKPGAFGQFITTSCHKMYPMGERENYELSPDDRVGVIGKRQGKTPTAVAYDAMMLNKGQALLYFPLFGYSTNDFTAIEETLRHPQTGIS